MYNELEYKIVQGKTDFADAKLIRQLVFVEEQGFENEFDDIDEFAYHLVIYQDHQAVATGRMYPKNQKTMILGRIATIKEYRKMHLGSKIVQLLEKEADKLGYTIFELSAQKQAQGFYEKLGYRVFGKIYYDEWCPHVKMKKYL